MIHTKQQKLITAMNLKTIHQKISGETFLRVSKSFVVNTDYIDSFDNHSIYIDESEIPLGEVYRSDFFTRFAGGLLNSD
ncbi:LytTR family DNA-binding domain-containing protein [Chryseobacterium sp. P1-3]|uniref:LytTR family DNA-binding domain-containing protein n=1 Tax=Chryseobacterium sp. (strain P1-3) TaxID=1517683 RepID=UPI000B2E413E|nr:LytTR family DNA-binding domain-containing protein [Chryseobacterium sp. P1-3]